MCERMGHRILSRFYGTENDMWNDPVCVVYWQKEEMFKPTRTAATATPTHINDCRDQVDNTNRRHNHHHNNNNTVLESPTSFINDSCNSLLSWI